MGKKGDSNPTPQTGEEAYCISAQEVSRIATSILKSNSLSVEIDWKLQVRMKLPKSPKISVLKNLYGARKRLPFSGHLLQMKKTKVDRYEITATGPATATWDSERKSTIDDDYAAILLDSIRLSQQLFIGHFNRLRSGDLLEEKIHISSALWDLIHELEHACSGKSDANDLQEKYDKVELLYRKRLNHLMAVFSNCNPDAPSQSVDKFPLGPQSDKFTRIPHGKIEVRRYLNLSPAFEVEDHIQFAVRSALRDLISFPPVDPKISETSRLSIPYPLPRLRVDKSLADPYQEVAALCDTILPQLTDKPDARQEVNEIKASVRNPITVERLLSPEDSTRALMDILIEFMTEFELTAVIESTLKKELPTLYNIAIQNGEDPNQLMRSTADTRGLLTSTENQLKNLETSVENFSQSSDQGAERIEATRLLKNFRKQLAEIRQLPEIERIHSAIEDFRNTIEDLERILEGSIVQSQEQKSSALWIGLGQGGSQILRECLLYCLDNLNDARSGSLLNALGIDPTEMAIPMRDRRADNREDQERAVETLQELCDAKLQALAINVGTDIDKLVLPDRPGHFLWGNVVLETELTDVVRKTRNTLRLDRVAKGSGGSTGLGRAYGFARRRQIRQVLKDVGKAKHGNVSPSHVIITHSFAGGSGSGMVLPILQEVRRAFNPETVVWVISVGVGGKERKIQAYYNTPFILSDILQAHYDGIHSPIDPVKEGQWNNFEIQLNAERNQMVRHLKTLMGEILDDNLDDEQAIVNALENALKDGTWRDKRNNMQKQALVLNTSDTYQDNIDDNGEIFDILDFEALMKKIPKGPDETKKFNDWCEDYEPEGGRPALNFWSAWSECASDPLGLFVSGEDDVSETSVDNQTEDERRRDFVPSLTTRDLDKVLKKLQNDQDPVIIQGADGEEILKEQKLGTNLKPLYRLLNDKWNKTEDVDKKAFVDFVQQELRGYKAALFNFNRLRKDMARQIRALTGSSNDERVKNIIVSNAHLEAGVDNSNIPVENEAYTVFNSVVFDFILNIIGSQIPPDGMYLTTDAEEFDEEDLVQQTRPPLVVGLMDHRDSRSLIERTLPNDDNRIKSLDIVTDFFIQDQLWDGFPNPLCCLGGTDSTIFLQNSLFDSTAISMLQVNPYEIQDEISEPTALKELLEQIRNKWDEDIDFLANERYNHQARKNLQKQSGCTVLHITNAIRWISVIEIEVLANIICADYSAQGASFKEERVTQVQAIMETLEKTWAQYRPTEQPKFQMPELKGNQDLGKFMRGSGQIRREDLEACLTKLGIWHEDVLRALPPAYLNAYLPPLLLKHTTAKLNDDEKKRKDRIESWCIWHNTSNLIQDMSKMSESALAKFNEMLGKLDLQLVLDYQDRDGFVPGPKLRLHPRLQRYFSAVRTLPSQPEDLLIPSRSTASLLPRYLMANEMDGGVGKFSAPTFQKAGDILNWYRYRGLLPDEYQFEWSSLLRMVLLCDTDFEKLEIRTSELASLGGFDFRKFTDEINDIFNEKYEQQDLHNPENPVNIWNQVSTLRRRMIKTRQLASSLQENLPDDWIDNKDAIETWIRILDQADLQDDENINLSFDDSASVRRMLQTIQGTLFEMNQQQKEGVENRQAGMNKASQRTRRIVYEIITLLNEGLAQAEYMSPNHRTDRVHYEMTGFSDRVSGRPAGLLCLSHDSGLMVGSYGDIKLTIRSNVEASLGYIDRTKEFFTASNFGPNASMTMVLSKAPTEEAARQFENVMQYLAGVTGNTDEYLGETKLHPYVFLYNILWLPANINRWTRVRNEEYIRRFQIPLNVIESHYSNPEKTRKDLKIIHEENAYKTGGVSLPEDDIRDFENCVKINGRYRNMINLLGIMALRHQLAAGDDNKLWEPAGLNADEYTAMKTAFERRAESIGKNCLDPDQSTSGGADSDSGQLCDVCYENPCICGDPGAGESDTQDTLENRGIAWFEAYKAWLDDHNTRAGKKDSGQAKVTLINDSPRDDEASKFEGNLDQQ